MNMSSVDSHSQQQQSVQNPKPSCTFTSFPPNLQQASMSSNLGDVSGGFCTGNRGQQQQNFSRYGSVVSGRARPRLVKMRKQSNGRSRGASGEFGSGCNPFRSSNGRSRSEKFVVNGGDFPSSAVVDNNFVGSSEVSSGNAEDVGFVFSAKQKQCGENDGKSETRAGSGKLDNMGTNGNYTNLKADFERSELSEFEAGFGSDVCNTSSGPEPEFQKNSNLNFEFGTSESKLGSSQKFEMGLSSKRVEKPGRDDPGFSFNVSQGGSNGNNCGTCPKFVFVNGTHGSQLNSNDNSKEFGESRESLVSCESTATEKVDQKAGDAPLRFKINPDKSSRDNYDAGVFVFGSSSNTNSSFIKPLATNCNDEMKSSSGTSKNCNSKENADDCLGSGSTSKCELPSSDNISSIGSASAVDSAFDLPDKIKELKIDGTKDDDDGRSNKSTPTNFDAFFVLQGRRKESEEDAASFGGSQGSTFDASREIGSHEFELNLNNDSCNVASSCSGTFTSEPSRFQGDTESRSFQAQGYGNELNTRTIPSAFAYHYFNSEANVEAESSTTSGTRKENDSSEMPADGLKVPFSDLRIPSWDTSSLKESLFPDLNRKVEFGFKYRLKKDRRLKSKGAKLRQPSQQKQHPPGEGHVEGKISGQDSPSSGGCYSPMDFSPYGETMAAPQAPGEASATSDQLSEHEEIRAHATAGSGLKEGKGLEKDGNMPNDTFHSKQCFTDDSSKMTCPSLNTEHMCSDNGGNVDSIENTDSLSSRTNCQVHFDFASCLQDTERREFCFSASPSVKNNVSTTRKHSYRRKYNQKPPCQPFVPCPGVKDLGEFSRKLGDKSEVNVQVKGSNSSSVSVQEACEKCRLRGNNAYKNGDLLKAEEFYTQGIDSVPSSETSGSCLKPLIICYSNRAATRMSLGDMRKALSDCAMAATLDPNFLKVQIRAGNCHLLLGEVELAMNYYNKCLESGFGVCLDRKITIEAADGLQKAQKVTKCVNNSVELLELKTPEAASRALDMISEALSISLYSEKLLEMKAECLFMLRKFEEVILLCEQTLAAAEKNFDSVSSNQLYGSQSINFPFQKLWRWHLTSKCHFYLGRLQVALEFLEKIEQMESANDKYASKLMESSTSLATSIRVLLHHKNAGNASVRSGKYAEAVEHYTAALSRSAESRPFAAICFCNRAAAYQALGQIADAVADCSLAISLDANYSKALSRRATLHEMIRDYGQTASDLQRLVSLLEEKAKQSGTGGRSTSGTKEIRQIQKRLSTLEEESKKGIPLDLYLILGVKKSETASEIKKAYRKAALRHHPDKVGQFLPRSESGIEGPQWKEIIQEVHKDADRLFKMIGEAYAVLSDTSKRSEYDIDEEIRKASKENYGTSPYRGKAGSTHYSPFQRNDNCQNWQHTWKTYGYTRSRW